MRGLCVLPTVASALFLVACGGDASTNPNTQPTDSIAASVPADVVSWLKQNASPITTPMPGGSDQDLAPLGATAGSAHLVALGEATHGTADFFNMKHRVLRYLVTQRGFTAFGIEATFPEAEYIDEYVRTGAGDPAVLLSRLFFWTWNTQEVLDMILWMRDYNRGVAPEKQVRFLGFDMQFPGAAMDSVQRYMDRVESAGADTVRSALACYRAYANDYRGASALSYSSASADVKARCKAGVAAAYAWVSSHRSAYEARTSQNAFERALQYARLVVQAEDALGGSDSGARDRYMAENTNWLLGRLPAGSRMMLWAHNGHVQRTGGTMGNYLATTYGADYVAIGFDFFDGMFNAVNMIEPGRYSGLTTHTVTNVPKASYEAYFHAAGIPRMFLRLRPSDALPGWLVGPRQERSIGAVYSAAYASQFYYSMSLPQLFDGVLVFDHTSPSQLLPFRYN